MEISCVTSLVDAKSYSVTQCYILSGYPTPSATSAQSQCHCRIRLPLHQFGCWPLRRALCGDGTVWYGGPSIWWYSGSPMIITTTVRSVIIIGGAISLVWLVSLLKSSQTISYVLASWNAMNTQFPNDTIFVAALLEFVCSSDNTIFIWW